MPLADCRNLLVETTGRYDLLDPAMQMNADYLLNVGQRYLDRKLDPIGKETRYFVDLDANQSLVLVPYYRVAKRAFVYNSTLRKELRRVSKETLRKMYPRPKSSVSTDIPGIFAPISITSATLDLDPSLFDQTWAFEDMNEDVQFEYNAIVVMPPCATGYTFELWATFYTPKLVQDADQTFWTEQHSEVLVAAAMRTLEFFYRNNEGRKSLDEALDGYILDINKDFTEDEMDNTRSVMGG